MGSTYFGSSIRSGSSPSDIQPTSQAGLESDIGWAVLGRTALVEANGQLTVDKKFRIPPRSHIFGFKLKTAVPFTATTVEARIGKTPGGQDFVTAVDVKPGGEAVITLTAAQIAAMDNTGPSGTDVCIRLTSTGATAVGTLIVEAQYAYGEWP